MFRFAAIAVSASILINTATLTAEQSFAKISAGQRVRITNDGGQLIGTVVSVAGDTVRITDGAQERMVPLAGVKRIDLSRGMTRKGAAAKKGALRWGLIFAAVGAVSLGLQHDDVGENGSSAGDAVALGLWSGGLFGGLIGAGVGAARAGEKWEKIFP